MIGLMLYLFALVSASTSFVFYDEPQQVPGGVTVARMSCADAQTTIYITPPVAVWIIVHELAHALDCQDDGRMNGSPWPSTAAAGMRPYCLRSKAELFACSVERLHPWWKVVRVR